MGKRMIFSLLCVLLLAGWAAAAPFEKIPARWKWLDDSQVAFSREGDYSEAFIVDARTRKTLREGVDLSGKAPQQALPLSDVENPTFSPDSSRLAYTRGGDLYVWEIAGGRERRLTFDGSADILNGYASWVYYEEIFGRPSRYRAFWWSPDSRRLAFYRFDNSRVPVFPIYSPFGPLGGVLRETRYPKAGQENPRVRIGLADLSDEAAPIVWADFDPEEDQYFGTPFWADDSRALYLSREPRIQNTLDLYRVDAATGAKSPVYHESSPTWLDWIEGMLFSEKGLYMVRSFETGWQQIYFLGYDGSLRRLTDGPNWRITLLRADGKGNVFFTAERDSHIRQTLYRVDAKGRISALTDPAYNAAGVVFSPRGDYFVAALSNYTTPTQVWLFETRRAADPKKRGGLKVADRAGADFDAGAFCLPQTLLLRTSDGLDLPAYIVYPKDFDPSRKYPVHVDIYGGPDTPLVRERWFEPERFRWWADNGIIEVTADCRAAGHNGREGLDRIYKRLSTIEIEDFVAWSAYLRSLPYVDGSRIGVEGFSFGGTMTALLVMEHSDAFPYGVAGGGVYDWALYDTHYTERFMETPQTNPEGYAATRAISRVSAYPAVNSDAPKGIDPVMLMLTHGTGDDNVHYQNTLLLVDALQREGKRFELMVYPDGMHGYRGYQGEHFEAATRDFWRKYLLREP